MPWDSLVPGGSGPHSATRRIHGILAGNIASVPTARAKSVSCP
jgi:hypothetical protein